MIPEMVEMEEKVDFAESFKYICISPLVLISPSFNDNEGKRYISPETDDFSDLLYESTMQRMAESGYYDQDQLSSFYKFQVVPDKDYLHKIQENQKKFARIYPVYDQDVRYEIRGYTFPFNLFAAKEVQEFVYTCGLGTFTHKGFGMLDLANSDPSKRAIEYKFEGSVYK
jgi:CRISPR-associated endoribonuclease Cas6